MGEGGVMLRRVLTVTMIAAIAGLSGSCSPTGQADDPAEAAFEKLRASWSDAEGPEAKSALAEQYLAEYPDTEHSASLAGAVAYYRGRELEDPAGALEVLSEARSKIKNPEQVFGVSMEMLALSDVTEVPLDLGQVADELAAVRPLSYGEAMQVAEAAVKLEEWTVAAEHAEAASLLATPEAFRADYPDREYSEEEVTRRADRRKASAYAHGGWAAYNLGDPEKAYELFAEADDVKSVNYAGAPDTPLYRFWGRAALADGDFDRAIELLAPDAIFGDDGGSMKYLREAFEAKGEDANRFDGFVWTTRAEFARTVDDFEALDYQGSPFRLSDVGDKVILLAFWFPT